jgi:molybdenum cofactor synthesis domain-containing protein
VSEGTLVEASLREDMRIQALALSDLTLGRRLRVGTSAVLQVTEIVLEDATPRWFARVVGSGAVVVGDRVTTDPLFDRPRFAVVTLSDRSAAGSRADESGPLAARILGNALGAAPLSTHVIADEADLLRECLVTLSDDRLCDLVVTTGGTGLSPRDVTPEATRAVIDREVPGIAEAIRAGGLLQTPYAMLSRAVCGLRGGTLIVNLSGSPKAVREQLAIVLPVLGHVLTTVSGVPVACATTLEDA